MLTTFAIIFTIGLVLGELFRRLKLPELLGMLVAGVILGPYCLGILSEEFVSGAADLRSAALVIILIRAGLGIKKDSLKGIGLPALQLSCIPCLIEGAFVMAAACYLLQMPIVEAGILAFIISAIFVPKKCNKSIFCAFSSENPYKKSQKTGRISAF